MDHRPVSPLFRMLRGCVRPFCPRYRAEGTELLPAKPAILVANHCQAHGPIAFELYAPRRSTTWCAGEMLDKTAVAEYAFRDFWSRKPRWTLPFYRLLSRAVVPLAGVIFQNARCIGVYRDARILSTFKNTVSSLEQGADVVIFPEHGAPKNSILYEFQDRFIDTAKLFFRRTGKRLSFVPVYVAPRLGTMYFCPPVEFDPAAPIEEERRRICACLSEAITEKARSLPRHTIVPYRNIPRRNWPKNK